MRKAVDEAGKMAWGQAAGAGWLFNAMLEPGA